MDPNRHQSFSQFNLCFSLSLVIHNETSNLSFPLTTCKLRHPKNHTKIPRPHVLSCLLACKQFKTKNNRSKENEVDPKYLMHPIRKTLKIKIKRK